jgi:hypothetical protein
MDSKIIHLFLNVILKELKQKEFKTEILKPVLKNILWYLLPYILFVICINMFFMIIALSIVLYFTKR